jgi:outer membrane protein assembly factor BamB
MLKMIAMFRRPPGILLASLILAGHGYAQTDVPTRSYDNSRCGANLEERLLTAEVVAKNGMKKQFSLNLAGDNPRVEAQPLYLAGLVMNDGKKHDVIFVFTMSNRIWAFDANTGMPIWKTPVNLGPAFFPKPGDIGGKINKSFGILSTPVIDRAAGEMYIVNWLSDEATHQDRTLKVHALRLTDGQAAQGKPPLPIQASIINAQGVKINLNQVQTQRAALLLTRLKGDAKLAPHRVLYVGLTGAESPPADGDPAKANHGWLVAFDIDAWKQAGAWIATPSSFGGGIWQGAQGPCADDDGNVYLATGNGGFLQKPQVKDFTGTTDFPECFAKLTLRQDAKETTLALSDWFIPYRDVNRKLWKQQDVAPFPRGYDYTDQDLGSAGPILPKGTDLLLGAGKDGVLYVLDRNNLGKAVGDFSKLKVPPTFFTFEPDKSIPAYANAKPDGNLDFKPSPGVKTYHLHGSPVHWWNDQHKDMLFVWGENTYLRAYALEKSGKTTLIARGKDIASAKLAVMANSMGGMPGGMLTLSANKGKAGIVWATAPTDGDANVDVVAGTLRAYDAANFVPAGKDGGTPFLKIIWETAGFTYSKFCPPVVADGRLIVATYDGRVDVYVCPGAMPAPAP